MNKLILAAVATAFTANVAMAQSVAEADGILAASGRTLYTFDKDAANKSNCNGSCAATWPPFVAQDDVPTTAEFSVITREDGAKQWALHEKPLYFFAGDAQAGDAKGDGKGGAWHVIRASAKHSEMEPAATTRAAGGYRPYSGAY